MPTSCSPAGAGVSRPCARTAAFQDSPGAAKVPYDAFSTGHSSTSISAGLGIACAKRLKGDGHKTIAVIGDGSMTAGLAFEGLNQAGDLRKEKENLLVILNDNDMSISPNVGALSSFLSRKLSAKRLQEWRKDFGSFLKALPGIGTDIYELAKRSEESFKTFVTPGMLFEAYNFDYFGPIKGHNLEHLIDILENIRHIQEPVLLHVTTVKGRGYPPAEKNPVYFHGCGAFEIETGTCPLSGRKAPTYTETFGQTLVELGTADRRIIAVTAAMPEGTGLAEFARRFPERCYDVGIAEPHGVTFAAGLATEGFRPVVAIYSTFLQRAYDQILHDVCLDALPVTFAIDRGGIVGEDGPTHQGLFDFAYLRSMPHMVVMAPSDENELRRMLRTAIDHDGPIALRYPRGAATGCDLEDPIQPLALGQAAIRRETGQDVLILSIGRPLAEALVAAERLEADGIGATVVDARFVKPLDSGLILRLAQRIPRIVTVEEHVCQGGFGSAVLECLADAGLTGWRLKRLGVADTFVEHGPQRILRARHGLDAAAIFDTARLLLADG